MSNDQYTSVDHRVVMNTSEEARVSIAVFFNPGKRGDSIFYGPIPELVSSENLTKYRNFTISEFLGTFFKRDLATKALVDHFKL
jgi:isopenicillin N synthase-like dioxygenase